MLADVSASRISTAELEMQAAPAIAAAAGGIVLRGIGAHPAVSHPEVATGMSRLMMGYGGDAIDVMVRSQHGFCS